jgi:hypothetical protein
MEPTREKEAGKTVNTGRTGLGTACREETSKMMNISIER